MLVQTTRSLAIWWRSSSTPCSRLCLPSCPVQNRIGAVSAPSTCRNGSIKRSRRFAQAGQPQPWTGCFPRYQRDRRRMMHLVYSHAKREGHGLPGKPYPGPGRGEDSAGTILECSARSALQDRFVPIGDPLSYCQHPWNLNEHDGGGLT